MSNTVNFKPPATDPNDASVSTLSQTVVDAIKQLVSGLSPLDRARVLREITDIIQPIPTPRAGEILGMIVRLLPAQRSWTVDELKQSVAREGIEAAPKEVYNAVGYLARKGHLRRVGYGRYVLDGVEIVTAEDLGGEGSRHEDGYRI